jgi:hypothetical protein
MSEPTPFDDRVQALVDQSTELHRSYMQKRDAGKLTGREWDELMQKTEALTGQLESLGFKLPEVRRPPTRQLTPEQLQAAEFAQRLKTRQGAIFSDFKSLYKRKAELDQQMLGSPDRSSV